MKLESAVDGPDGLPLPHATTAASMVNAKPDGYLISQMPITVFRIPHMQKASFDAKRGHTRWRLSQAFHRAYTQTRLEGEPR